VNRPVDATIVVPGSKSLTNRHLAIAAIATGESTLDGALACDDCDRLVAALRGFGVAVESEASRRVVHGGGGRLPRGAGAVNLGDGGTPTRFAIALATLAAGESMVDGSPRMRERPVAEGVAILRELGASIELAPGERLPARVRGGGLRGGSAEVGRTASSQAISAALLVAAASERGVELRFREPPTSGSYVALTVAALRAWGVRVEVEGEPDAPRRIAIPAQPIAARRVAIEPDASSAVFPAAAAVLAGGRVRIPGLPVGSIQPDMEFLRGLAVHGATVRDDGAGGTLVEAPGGVRATVADLAASPDAAVLAMAMAALADGPSEFTGLATLRVKESDRIEAVAAGLRALAGTVETAADRVRIHPLPPAIRTARIDPRRDHRVAMAFALLGLVRPGIEVLEPGCVAKSWPGFWTALAAIDRSRGADLPLPATSRENASE
jgi:3-phosphoshikimate 1-carboxyvinyltransferase